MIVLSCKNISKSYGIDEILKDVTLSINEGDRVGIIGANGEGKSTLFKILSKQLSFDDGEIFIDKNKTLGYLAQHLDLDTKNTIYNEMLLVFSDLIRLEEKLLDLENKMNEPYDESKADYHNKIINDYNTSQELYSHRGGYTYKGEINKVLKGLGFSEEDFDKEISNKDNINGYYIVDNNDFIYNPRISTLAPVGPINRNKLNRTGIMSPLYTVFRSSNVDLGFLEWYFQSSHWHRYMKLNGDSGARADRIAIKDSTFFEMPIKIPVNIKEQVLIGETLEKFNQYITLHQQEPFLCGNSVNGGVELC